MNKCLKVSLVTIGLIGLAGCSNQTKSTETTSQSTKVTSLQVLSNQEQVSTTQTMMKDTQKKVYQSGSLLQAVEQKNTQQVTDILVQGNYPINEVNAKKETPLLIATHQNDVAIAKLLIDAGADINQQDAIQDSPYLYAGAEGRTDILSYMLKNATPDYQRVNRFGGNALIPAAEKGHLDTVKVLLADGRENINHQNNYGYTALIEAVALRDGSLVYQNIVRELLNAGADANLADNSGRTALDYAQQKGYQAMVELLQ